MAVETYNNIEGMLLIGDEAGVATLWEGVREWSIDPSTNSSPSTTQGATWGTKTLGVSEIDMSVTAVYNLANGGGRVQNYAINRTLVKVYAYPSRNKMGVFWTLVGWVGGGGKTGGAEDTGEQSYDIINRDAPVYTHPS